MESKQKSKSLRKLSLSIGDFIRYWGFRRIHGAIWTQVYLSKTPLSCTDLTRRLGLSKALISPALDELRSFKLIEEVPSPNNKTKLYTATMNISEVIQHILETRESKMLKQITKDFSTFLDAGDEDNSISQERVESLSEMIIAGNLMLEFFLKQKDLMNLPSELQV